MPVTLTSSAFDRPVHHPALAVACYLCRAPTPAPAMAYVHFAFLPKPYVAVCRACAPSGSRDT
jgi:hypothetical protein